MREKTATGWRIRCDGACGRGFEAATQKALQEQRRLFDWTKWNDRFFCPACQSILEIEKELTRLKPLTPVKQRNKVAATFQRLVRAEAALVEAGYSQHVFNGALVTVNNRVGTCVCITCGRVHDWDSGVIQGGHYQSRKYASTLLDGRNVHPQCTNCNDHHSGRKDRHAAYIDLIHGEGTAQALERIAHARPAPTEWELAKAHVSFRARLKAAEQQLATR